MVLIDRSWDDVRRNGDRGFDKLRTQTVTVKTNSGVGEGSSKYQSSLSMPVSPVGPMTPTTPSPTAARKDNVWRSVFNPGSNLATKNIGAQVFDKPKNTNSPTVYDWLYSGETRSKHR
ncbi:PREDICTED: dormancy-associated protein 1-like [Ipomoea nil]|uniref:dormancy-associated protein 1-like n=1 Tax=Ipomoea nil TaxID=35883 RepID=UPI0009014A7F|nr:PREDICTED: dormancy-associated protein 1-like [Ipomoea nil]